MTQAARRTCNAVVVLVGPGTSEAPNVNVELAIARNLKIPVFQMVSPEATRHFMPGAGPAVPWSLEGMLQQLATI